MEQFIILGTTFQAHRQKQNKQGKAIKHIGTYFNTLAHKIGYFNAKKDMRKRCHIFINIKP